MPLLIGMDEAGYGPNLGPLVVTVVAWEVAGDVRQTDLWRAFDGIVSPEPASEGEHLQIGDSKAVYTPARGLAALERGVLSAFSLWQGGHGRNCDARIGNGASLPRTFHALRNLATGRINGESDMEPWFQESDLELPHANSGSGNREDEHRARLTASWEERCRDKGICLRAICSGVVSPKEFNERTRRHDSKGQALTEVSLELLARVWRELAADRDEAALIIADKHGGRNRYHDFLPVVFGDRFIRCRGESLEQSRYQVGNADIRFETKSERHLPVALASMVSKYLRELSMVQFNQFWTTRLPGLKPTAGYPADSRRYRREIAALQKKLGIADEVLWRER